MVPHIPPVEVLMGVVSKDSLVLGAVEDATASTHHGRYGHYLLRALHSKRRVLAVNAAFVCRQRLC